MAKPQKPTVHQIDGVNYVRRTIPTSAGPVTLEGLTVRALRSALAEADADALVVYMAEQGEGVVLGCIGGFAYDSPQHQVAFLVGPESIRPIKSYAAAFDVAEPPPVDRTQATTTDGKPFDRKAPARPDGQHQNYIVLTEDERRKGFVRPVRYAYIHEKCCTRTTMGQAIAETYARDPEFYGATFCCGCRAHFPVGPHGEFHWEDGSKVGS